MTLRRLPAISRGSCSAGEQTLDELASFDPRKSELVQLCVFRGCGRSEAAELLDISLATAKRDVRLARAWLSRRLRFDADGAEASRWRRRGGRAP